MAKKFLQEEKKNTVVQSRQSNQGASIQAKSSGSKDNSSTGDSDSIFNNAPDLQELLKTVGQMVTQHLFYGMEYLGKLAKKGYTYLSSKAIEAYSYVAEKWDKAPDEGDEASRAVLISALEAGIIETWEMTTGRIRFVQPNNGIVGVRFDAIDKIGKLPKQKVIELADSFRGEIASGRIKLRGDETVPLPKNWDELGNILKVRGTMFLEGLGESALKNVGGKAFESAKSTALDMLKKDKWSKEEILGVLNTICWTTLMAIVEREHLKKILNVSEIKIPIPLPDLSFSVGEENVFGKGGTFSLKIKPVFSDVRGLMWETAAKDLFDADQTFRLEFKTFLSRPEGRKEPFVPGFETDPRISEGTKQVLRDINKGIKRVP